MEGRLVRVLDDWCPMIACYHLIEGDGPEQSWKFIYLEEGIMADWSRRFGNDIKVCCRVHIN
ncbi:hypothetical protein ALP64_200810 [Pseudomonas syringae pv. actinidiae]|nr:hypothetical protein ALP64_200810 [Pseudomonas syringae pv. actinidiae]BBI46869.1 hypothetical protein KPSA1B_105644 [Pseudomonas syringae pv. actinidiae]